MLLRPQPELSDLIQPGIIGLSILVCIFCYKFFLNKNIDVVYIGIKCLLWYLLASILAVVGLDYILHNQLDLNSQNTRLITTGVFESLTILTLLAYIKYTQKTTYSNIRNYVIGVFITTISYISLMTNNGDVSTIIKIFNAIYMILWGLIVGEILYIFKKNIYVQWAPLVTAGIIVTAGFLNII